MSVESKKLVFTKILLELKFIIRGGSDVRMRRTVLLCVSNGKVHKALDVLSDVVSRVNTVYNKEADSLKLFDEKEDYHTKLSIVKTDDHVKAMLLETKKIESKYNPKQNVSFEKSYELSFDPIGCFFYNSTKQIDKHRTVYTGQGNKSISKFIPGEVPCVALYESLYLFVDNEWCLSNRDGSLSCL